MTIQRILPLAALATALTFASHAGAQVTTQQDSSKATTSVGSGSMGTQTPTTTTTPTTPTPPTTQDLNATTPPATTPTPMQDMNATTPPSTVNQSNMSGQSNNPNGGMSGSNACSSMSNADCTSGLVRPGNGATTNGDMNTGDRPHMRVGKDTSNNGSGS